MLSIIHSNRQLNQSARNVMKRGLSNLFILKNDEAFNKQKKEILGKKILYFTASWCPPCKAIAPVFESLSKKHSSLSFIKIDVDSLPETALDYSIRSVPTFVFLNENKALSQFSGADESMLNNSIAELEKA